MRCLVSVIIWIIPHLSLLKAENDRNDNYNNPDQCVGSQPPSKPHKSAGWVNENWFAPLYQNGHPSMEQLGDLYARYECGEQNGPGKLCIKGKVAGIAEYFKIGTTHVSLYDVNEFFGVDQFLTIQYNHDSEPTEFEGCFRVMPEHKKCHNEIEVKSDTECKVASTGTKFTEQLNFRIGLDLTCDPDITGDPHLKSWGGQRWDYHGECDLVAMRDPTFDNGKGLELHVRTTRDHHYSYTNEAALKIGDDIFEVHSMSDYKLNGIPGTFTNTTSDTIGGYRLSHWHSGSRNNLFFHRHVVHLGDGGAMIEMKTFENIVYIEVSNGKDRVFVNMNGLFGDYRSGKLLGRDGVTVYEPSEEFALEWQVRDTDPKLFSTDRAPIFPDKCLPPRKFIPRLGQKQAQTQAAELCAEWDGGDKDSCIYDIIASGNKDLAMYKVMEGEAKDAAAAELLLYEEK